MRRKVKEEIRKHDSHLATKFVQKENSGKRVEKASSLWKKDIKPCRDKTTFAQRPKITTKFDRELYSTKIQVDKITT